MRLSGTEPKIKVHLEVIEAVGEPDARATARHTASGRLAAIRGGMEQLTQLLVVLVREGPVSVGVHVRTILG